MKTIINLECTECKRRNYSTTKNSKTVTEKIRIKKYCKFCRQHTTHREVKA